MQELAGQIVAELEKGVIPSHRTWDPEKAGGPQAPFNPTTNARYHGINTLILGMELRAFQSGDPRWATFTGRPASRGAKCARARRPPPSFSQNPMKLRTSGPRTAKSPFTS
jgi:antirestriction protein ArdC